MRPIFSTGLSMTFQTSATMNTLTLNTHLKAGKMRMRMKGFMAQSLTILLLLSVVSLNFLSLLHDKHMMLQQLSPTDFHTIDADLWGIIKYIFVVIAGFLVYYAKVIASDIQTMKVDIALMKQNSDATQDKLKGIARDIDVISEQLKDHDKRLIYLEKERYQ